MNLRNKLSVYRERFIRWLAREYIQQERDIFTHFREGCIRESKAEKAETARLAKLATRYAEALAVICRLRANSPASEIAYRAFRDGPLFQDSFLRPEKQTLRSFIEMETGVSASASPETPGSTASPCAAHPSAPPAPAAEPPA